MSLKKLFIKIRSIFFRIGLKNHNFSIISNNCWGGIVSRDRNIPYNSPTVGLFFYSDDYLKFLANLNYYLSLNMQNISIYESKYSRLLLEKYNDSLIIGKLEDIEVIMLHYKTFEEAKTKWDRRKSRINYNNLLVKFSDQNLFDEHHFLEFEKLDFKNKLFITTNHKYKSTFTCIVDDVWNCGFAKDDIKTSFKKININNLLNNLKS